MNEKDIKKFLVTGYFNTQDFIKFYNQNPNRPSLEDYIRICEKAILSIEMDLKKKYDLQINKLERLITYAIKTKNQEDEKHFRSKLNDFRISYQDKISKQYIDSYSIGYNTLSIMKRNLQESRRKLQLQYIDTIYMEDYNHDIFTSLNAEKILYRFLTEFKATEDISIVDYRFIFDTMLRQKYIKDEVKVEDFLKYLNQNFCKKRPIKGLYANSNPAKGPMKRRMAFYNKIKNEVLTQI